MRHFFVKYGAPVWIHVPGTPFTLAGFPERYERLPGMTEWAPRRTVENVGKQLQTAAPMEQIAADEANAGLGTSVGTGAIAGTTGGLLAGRLASGDNFAAPFKKLLSKGLSRDTLRGLKNIPRSSKIAPLIGLGAGAAAGLGHWASGREDRRQTANEVAKGLLSEQVLQQHSLNQARQSAQPSALQGLPVDTATAPAPIVTTQSNTGA
jgi:hypothetical protein